MSADFVLDSSVALSWAFEDERTSNSVRIHELLDTQTAIVPGLWKAEVANVLLINERRSRITPDKSTAFLDLLANSSIIVEPEPSWERLERIKHLASTYQLTVYDGYYLELATRLGIPLATFDDALKKAAGAARVVII